MLNNYYIQRNLQFLGYYKGKIDEDIGVLSKKAIKEFKRDFGLPENNVYNEETDVVLQRVIKEMQVILQCSMIDGKAGNETNNNYDNFKGIKHFKRSEFKCKCGCGADRIDIRLVKILDNIRDYYGKPAIITSGVRCPNHNKAVGGTSTSWHLSTRGGKASDFYISGIKVTDLLSHCIDLRNQGKIRYCYTNNTTMNGVVHIDIGGIK